MINKHDHGKECQHAELKFCRDCKVPHCLSCGKEWREQSYWYSTVPTHYTKPASYPDTITITTTPIVNLCKHEAK